MGISPNKLIPDALKPNSTKEKSDMGNLGKASLIELFFDLVLIVCMRCIVPTLLSGEGSEIDGYAYYIFFFTFVLMLQIWFSTTVLMNRCGDESPKDAVFLLINMFLLFLMTQAISLGWEHYIAFNVTWILINANLCINWWLRLKALGAEVSPADRRFIIRIITVHAMQAFLVLLSFAFSSVPAQVCCGIALAVGFLSWPTSTPLSDTGREHLAERCSLLLVLIFGEALVSLNQMVLENRSTVNTTSILTLITAVYFLIVIGLFLIYLLQVRFRVDQRKLRSGSRYMALTAWIAFCMVNVTAAFEIMTEQKSILILDGDSFLALWLIIYMLSFFLFRPFNHSEIKPSKLRTAVRTLCCFLPVVSVALAIAVISYSGSMTDTADIVTAVLFMVSAAASLILYSLSVLVVFLIDYRTLFPRKKHRRKKAENKVS